ALVWELGYVRVIDLSGHRLFLSGELELPTASADFGDYRLRLGASTILLGEHARRWRLAGALSPTLRATSNALANMTSARADVRLTGGWYSEGGFVAAEAGLDWSAATYISNSAAYRMTYPGAQDGWYDSTGGTIYAGLVGGLSFGHWDAILRVGVPRAVDLSPQ